MAQGGISGGGQDYMILVIAISVLSLLAALGFARYVLAQDAGTAQMQKISNAIKAGAEAFLRRQYRTIILLAIVLAAIIMPDTTSARAMPRWRIRMTVSFVLGAACSVLAGYIGMWVSIRTNIRTASAARTSLNTRCRSRCAAARCPGLGVVALSLLGVGGLFLVFVSWPGRHQGIPLLIVGYGFGASFVALFAQLGGGIYTKAADVGADLVGKVEAGIPEDDPRNPAVIADLVGDNVGDCAGRGADLFESTAAENIGAMILGVALCYAANFGVLDAASCSSRWSPAPSASSPRSSAS